MVTGNGRISVPATFGSGGGGSSADERVKVTVSDTTAGFLQDKLTSGDGSITFALVNPGGIEVLDIRAVASGGAAEVPCLVGSIIDIDAGESLSATWGHRRATAGPVALRGGEIIGISAALDRPLAGSGSLNFRVTLDGIAQNAAGQTLNLIFTGPTQSGLLDFATPIPFTAGQTIDMVCQAATPQAPANLDATIGIWYRLL